MRDHSGHVVLLAVAHIAPSAARLALHAVITLATDSVATRATAMTGQLADRVLRLGVLFMLVRPWHLLIVLLGNALTTAGKRHDLPVAP